jgi:hypothetical protein
MDWKDRVPEGVSDVRQTDQGFEAKVSIPVSEDGFLGRQCRECSRRFTLGGETWERVEVEELTCCYCGHVEDDSEFLTTEQRQRVEAAALELSRQYAEQAIADMFRGVQRRQSRNSFIRIEVKEPAARLIPALPEYVEEQAKRILTCSQCGARYGVLGAAAFCPICGPRSPAESLADAIASSRQTLALEDALDADTRETARAAGVFEDSAANVVKGVVTQFEVATKADFRRRVPTADTILKKEPGNIFQRLDDVERLYRDHASIDVPAVIGTDRWERLRVTFQQRHVLIHLHGHVDQKYLDRVSGSRLTIGQRLVISRARAEQALEDLEAAVAQLVAV